MLIVFPSSTLAITVVALTIWVEFGGAVEITDCVLIGVGSKGDKEGDEVGKLGANLAS